MAELVAKRYAVAFYELAIEENMLDTWYGELNAIVESFYGEKDFMTILNSPRLNRQEKKNLVDKVLEGKASGAVDNLLKLLIDRDRFRILDEVFEELEKLYLNEKNIVHAEVYSVMNLGEARLEELKKILEVKLEKHIVIENKIDASLIGGIMLKIGDKIIDGSIKRRLELLKDDLLTAKH